MTSGVLKQVAIHNCFRCAHSTQILGFFLSPKKTFATTEQFRVHLPNNLTSSSTSAYLFSLPQRNETGASGEHYGTGRHGPRNSYVKGTGVGPAALAPLPAARAFRRSGQGKRSCRARVARVLTEKEPGSAGHSHGRPLHSLSSCCSALAFINNERAHQLAIAYAAEPSLPVPDYLPAYS
jgi:hypothetical protein